MEYRKFIFRETGIVAIGQVLSLRRYLKRISPHQVHTLSKNNPEFFFDMLPYAVALGGDSAFARRFGKLPLPEDSYLLCGAPREMTAAQFASRLRKAADVLNQRQKKLPYEQFKTK